MIQEPMTWKERSGIATECVAALEIQHLPTLIDEMDDRVGGVYQGFPDRLYLVGRDGKIAYQGGPGPFGFRPSELDDAIKAELKKQRK